MLHPLTNAAHAAPRATLLLAGLCLGLLLDATASAQLRKGMEVVKREDFDKQQADVAKTQRLSPHLSLNIHGHTAPVRAMAFSPDSKRLFTAGMDKVVHVWTRAPGAKAIVREHAGWSKSHTIRWEIARGPRGAINSLAVSPDGREVVIAGFGARGSAGEVIWADVDDGSFVHSNNQAHYERISSSAWSADGHWLATSDLLGRVNVWDMRGGEPRPRIINDDGHRDLVRPIAFAGNVVVFPQFAGETDGHKPDGRTVKVASLKLLNFDPARGRMAATLKPLQLEYVLALAGSRTGVIASADGGRNLYLFRRGETEGKLLVKDHLVVGLSLSDDGRWLAVATHGEAGREPPQVQIWDTVARRLTHVAHMPRRVETVAISPNGKWVAHTGGQGHHVFLMQLEGGKPVGDGEILFGGDRVESISASRRPGDYRVVMKSSTGEVQSFDPAGLDDDPLRGAREKAMLVEPRRSDWTVEVALDRYSLQLRRDGVNQGRITLNPTSHGHITNRNAWCFVPGENGDPIALAIGTNEGQGVYIYELAAKGECKMLRFCRGHSDEVTTLATTADGRYLVSGAADGTVRYWQLAGLDGRGVPRRWGAELVAEEGEGLGARNVVETGPLFHKGVRDGDIIKEIQFAERGRDGNLVTYRSTDPDVMYSQLQNLPWDTQLAFIVERRGEVQPVFNLISGWQHALAVFVFRDDWIAWHSSGYYACSPGGARLIGWQINQDFGDTPRLHPAARFHKSLYRPAELKEMLFAGGIARTEVQREQVLSEPPAPPLVELLTPAGPRSEQMEKKLFVKARAKARGAEPIVSMQLLINNVPVPQHVKSIIREREPDAGEAEHAWVEREWTIELAPGEHLVTVRADTPQSYALSDSVYVTYEPAKAQRTLHMLAVGIKDYKDAKLNLLYPVADAERVAKILKARSRVDGMFDRVEVTSVFNGDADHDGIRAAMNSVTQSVAMNDLVVLFYSGHGHRIEEKFYLVSHDANAENLAEKGVSEDEIKQFCRDVASKGGRMLILLDACHSGGMRLDKLTSVMGSDFGVAMMTSSKGDEMSFEHDKFSGGCFTEALFCGLEKGEADQAMVPDYRIDNDELGVYVRRKVPMLVNEIAAELKRAYPDHFKDKDPTQTPVNNFQALEPFPLTMVSSGE